MPSVKDLGYAKYTLTTATLKSSSIFHSGGTPFVNTIDWSPATIYDPNGIAPLTFITTGLYQPSIAKTGFYTCGVKVQYTAAQSLSNYWSVAFFPNNNTSVSHAEEWGGYSYPIYAPASAYTPERGVIINAYMVAGYSLELLVGFDYPHDETVDVTLVVRPLIYG